MSKDKKKLSTRVKILTGIFGFIGIIYWMIGKAQNVIEALIIENN